MAADEQHPGSGLPDHLYDLTLLLQQAAEDAHRYESFAFDAESVGDAELADWCRELAASDREITDRAARMLHARLGDLMSGRS